MRKHRKRRVIGGFLCTAAFTAAMSATVFAGQWVKNDTGWWYDNGNGTWPVNSWQWIDGNGDGTAECYYFNQDGYCLVNTKAPGGYTVNRSGAWTENGQVVTKTLKAQIDDKLLEKILEPVVQELDTDAGSHGTKVMSGSDIDGEYYLSYLLNDEMYRETSILFGTPENYQFDKENAFQVIKDSYGVQVSEENLRKNGYFLITDTKIGVQGADGEASPKITVKEQKIENGHLIVTFSYEMLHSVSEYDYKGKGTAIFVHNPGSFFGYSLESVQI